jgi:hypothetical protein
MQAYVDSEPHLGISARLDHFCDEAAFVDWERAGTDLPDWQTSWRHLTADGRRPSSPTHRLQITLVISPGRSSRPQAFPAAATATCGAAGQRRPRPRSRT